MERSAHMETKQKEIGISGLIWEIADASMKMVRTRVTAYSLTDLRDLFFGPMWAAGKMKETGTRQPDEERSEG